MVEKTDVPPIPETRTPPGKMTYEEFLAWADDDTHAEWVDGDVEFMSPITNKHSMVKGFLQTIIRTFAEVKGSGTVRDEPFQMKTGPNLPGRSPDIIFIAAEHLGRLRDLYLDGPADIAVEIVSPGSRKRDRADKLYEYEEGRVREYWLIDPERKEARFYVLNARGAYDLASPEEQGIYHSTVLDGFWLRVDWLWQDPLPPLLDVLRTWGLLPD